MAMTKCGKFDKSMKVNERDEEKWKITKEEPATGGMTDEILWRQSQNFHDTRELFDLVFTRK